MTSKEQRQFQIDLIESWTKDKVNPMTREAALALFNEIYAIDIKET